VPIFSRLIVAIAIAFAFCGCRKEVNWSDIQKKVDSKTGAIFGLGPGLYYCGSDSGRHYFRITGESSLGDKDDVFVERDKAPAGIKERPYSENESDWVCLDRIPTSSGIGHYGGLNTIAP